MTDCAENLQECTKIHSAKLSHLGGGGGSKPYNTDFGKNIRGKAKSFTMDLILKYSG